MPGGIFQYITRNLRMKIWGPSSTHWQDSVNAALGNLDDNCDTRLKIAVEDVANPIDVRFYGGWYSLNGVMTYKAGLRNQTGAGWAGGGTFYAYITEADSLILDGISAPLSNQVPLAQIVVDASGRITSITDMRVSAGCYGDTPLDITALAPQPPVQGNHEFTVNDLGAGVIIDGFIGGIDGQTITIVVADAVSSFVSGGVGPEPLFTIGGAPVGPFATPQAIQFTFRLLPIPGWYQVGI